MKRRSRQKLFYPVGLLSLAVIPVFFFTTLVAVYHKKYDPEHTLEINFAKEKSSSEGDSIFFASTFSKKRNYFIFKLNNDSIHNYYFIEAARKTLNKIKSNQDTVNGIKIEFNDSSKYDDFIKVVDNCYERWPYIFAPSGSNLWALYINVDSIAFYNKKLGWQKERERCGAGMIKY